MFAISARAVRLISLFTVCASFHVFGPPCARAQDRREPRLPGAVTAAPSWLKDAPFDVAKFFEMPRPEENAAPQYLDALYDFGPEMADCFPLDRRQRSPVAKARSERTTAIYSAWSDNHESISTMRIDELLAEHTEGFRKLDLAQQRTRCVFATGVNYDSPLMHAQVARQVVRLLSLKADRDLAGGDFDHALGCLDRSLRISRDIRPRGAMMIQLVSTAIDGVCGNTIVPLFLADPGLRTEHCDRILELLGRQEGEAIDSFASGVESEYVQTRVFLRVFSDRIKLATDAEGRSEEVKLDRQGVAQFFSDFIGAAADGQKPAQAPPTAKGGLGLAFLSAYLVLHSPGMAAERRAADNIAVSLLAVSRSTYAERRRVWAELEEKHLKSKAPESPLLVKLNCPDFGMMSLVCARDVLYIRAAVCLVALRRWELTHSAPSTDLEVVARAAGLPGVPIDPFSGRPLLLGSSADGPFVYSVGADGRDDRGLKDSNMGRLPEGDILFRMPKIKPRAR